MSKRTSTSVTIYKGQMGKNNRPSVLLKNIYLWSSLYKFTKIYFAVCTPLKI
uniref:Uncharacterized protein n=1 Tax=Anguilla anguilla TaxID=7936 RepID=A0A0E9WN63_ANGAN